MKKLYRMVIFLVALFCLPVSLSAQTMADRVRSLEATVEQLQETLIEMRAKMAAEQAAAESAEKFAASGVVRSSGEDIMLSTTGGGIKIKSSNGNAFQFGGRLMLDYDFYDFDGNPEGSDGEWRRARITAKGTVKKDWHYGFTLNIDDQDDEADINTAYIKYSGFKPLDLTFGKFKEPFGLERLTSSKWITTIERSMILDVVNEGHGQPYLGGAMISGYHAEMGNLNWALGVFDDGREDGDGDDNYAVTGRVAAAPQFGNDSFMHLAFAFSERARESDLYGVRTRFGVHTNDGARTTLGEIIGNDATQWGLEGAFVTGPFSLQAEYVDLEVDGADGSNDLEADGYYLQGAWTVTGEPRSYKKKGAYFDKVKPKSAIGAWEWVVRFDAIDVEVGNVDNDAEQWLLGVNWYANSNVKFMLNYIDAEADLEHADDVDGEALTLRAQYAF